MLNTLATQKRIDEILESKSLLIVSFYLRQTACKQIQQAIFDPANDGGGRDAANLCDVVGRIGVFDWGRASASHLEIGG